MSKTAENISDVDSFSSKAYGIHLPGNLTAKILKDLVVVTENELYEQIKAKSFWDEQHNDQNN